MRGSKLEHLQIALRDERSRRVVVVSHCILNENVRYLGAAGRPGSVDELVDRFQDEGVGIYQMPCPEQRAWGGVLKRHLGFAYGARATLPYRCRRPLTWLFVWYTRTVDAHLARRVVRDIADYDRSGFVVIGIVGVGSSPSCGVFNTLDVRRSLDVIADVDVATVDARRFNAALMGAARTDGDGSGRCVTPIPTRSTLTSSMPFFVGSPSCELGATPGRCARHDASVRWRPKVGRPILGTR